MQKMEELEAGVRLPTPKGVALAVMEVCRREDATIAEIAKLVMTDPALSSRLLQLANSAAYSRRPVASVPDAVMRLGLSTVRMLAMGFSLADQYPSGPCQGFDYPGFWSHSLLMAVACQQLGELTRNGSPDELFACGLLARIGCLALATIYPVEYAELLAQQAGEPLLERERERLHVDHNELTAAILADCGIPLSLAEPACHHEIPGASGFSEGSRPYELAHLFHHAKRLADLGLMPEAERYRKIPELMLLGGRIGLDVDTLGKLVDGIFLRWREWGDLLKVPTRAFPSFAKLAVAPAPKADGVDNLSGLRVLLVEDDATSRIVTEGILARLLGCPVHSAVNGEEALVMALEVMPQIVVTDWVMPVMDGVEFCRALRATEWGQSMYVIMLTAVDEEEAIVDAFEAGVDDYVTKPVNIPALRARTRAALRYVKLLNAWETDRAQLKQFTAELAISNRKLEHAALTDLLTGMPNRRAGLDALSQEWSGANRSGQPLSVIMIDIDHFKSINDTHGHAVGDAVLKEAAKAIQNMARKDDSVCRLGGEEFLIVCHNTDLKSAYHAAERLRKRVGATDIRVGDAPIRIAISVGVACKEPGMANAETMVNAADRALYAAKHEGRNRTCLASGDRVVCPHGQHLPEYLS
jgi:diguanylate cyclase (GGDEF)-like protein